MAVERPRQRGTVRNFDLEIRHIAQFEQLGEGQQGVHLLVAVIDQVVPLHGQLRLQLQPVTNGQCPRLDQFGSSFDLTFEGRYLRLRNEQLFPIVQHLQIGPCHSHRYLILNAFHILHRGQQAELRSPQLVHLLHSRKKSRAQRDASASIVDTFVRDVVIGRRVERPTERDVVPHSRIEVREVVQFTLCTLDTGILDRIQALFHLDIVFDSVSDTAFDAPRFVCLQRSGRRHAQQRDTSDNRGWFHHTFGYRGHKVRKLFGLGMVILAERSFSERVFYCPSICAILRPAGHRLPYWSARHSSQGRASPAAALSGTPIHGERWP